MNDPDRQTDTGDSSDQGSEASSNGSSDTNPGPTEDSASSTNSDESGQNSGGEDEDGGVGEDAGSEENPARGSLMHAFIEDATQRVQNIDSQAVLTQVNALGIETDGSVDIEGQTEFVRRWNLGFWNHAEGRGISVIYMSEDFTGDYPHIDNPAGNISERPAIVQPSLLPDSDVLIQAYINAAACNAPTGAEADSFLVRNDPELGGNLVQVMASGTGWGAVIEGNGLREWDPCN